MSELSMLDLPVSAQQTGRIQGLSSAIRIIEEAREGWREGGNTEIDHALMETALVIQRRMLEE